VVVLGLAERAVLRRWWNSSKTLFGVKSKEAMDSRVAIHAAITGAGNHDQNPRNEANRVVVDRTRVADRLREVTKQIGEAKELARQALLKSDAAMNAGNTAEGEKWTAAAQAIAMRLRASQKSLDAMQQQLATADQQAAPMDGTALTAETPVDALDELEREVDLTSANSVLDELRAELELGPAPPSMSDTSPSSGNREDTADEPTQSGD
jgi:hypothetical protein